MTTAIGKPRPFHESVVDAIKLASTRELELLATLIKSTKIPAGYDEIVIAWNQRRQEMCWGDEDLGVPEYLDAQKKAGKTEEPGTIDLDELQKTVEKLLSLLKDRQLGLMVWNEFLLERLTELHGMTSKVVK